MEYKDTLNLPETDFPMKADLPTREPRIAETWSANDVYAKTAHRPGAERFVLHDGPPYSNGDIHMGHALNKILKDIIVKYKAMQGFAAPYVPGWDNHGLPIEVNVVKEFRKKGEVPDKITLRKRCREYAREFVDRQKGQFARLGVRGDWENPYLTMSTEFEAEIVRTFGDLVEKGFVYRGLKPVYWCPTDETALADAEIEYVEGKKDPSIYVRFPLARDPHGVFEGAAKDHCYTVIWTTTPWTIPANVAVAVSPTAEYVVAKTGHGAVYVLAGALLERAMAAVGVTEYEVVRRVTGRDLSGLVFKHPLHTVSGGVFDRDSVLVHADYVTMEDGTGVVHTAPGHGKEDFATGQTYGLETIQPVLANGVFDASAGEFEGLNLADGGRRVIERLTEAGNLLAEQEIVHSYPHCWRCHNPVIFRATVQWFMNIDHGVDGQSFRQTALDAIQSVQWFPPDSVHRISAMVGGRPDWCLSRQRAWGVGIPVFYYQGQPVMTPESLQAVYELTRREGSDAWFEKTPSEILPPGFVCPHGGDVAEYTKETDVLDVWFDSGSTCRAVLEVRPELRFPADVYLEGSDQHRGWFNSSLMVGVATRGLAPYRQVITNGWMLDEKGRAMSKSAGNGIPPSAVVEQYGADVLRLWVASINYFEDVRFGPNILKQVADSYRRIRNTLRFLLGALADFTPGHDSVSPEELTEIDRWGLDRLQTLVTDVTRAYEAYEFQKATRAIVDYCTTDLSSFYLDVLKDRLYANAPNDPARRSSQTALYEIASVLCRLLSPILSHTAEEAWQMLPGAAEVSPSVEMAVFPAPDTLYQDSDLRQKWASLFTLRDEVNKALENARQGGTVKKSLEAKVSLFGANDATLGFTDSDLTALFLVSQVVRASDDAGARITVETAEGAKCVRCWLIKRDLGADPAHPEICGRCAAAVAALAGSLA
ncbi:MAG: isoleucine--tRNA ligase [Cytophagales bacterium]|nr:isoleucine--tRNA ligase [Armatimonadota bacterium]